MARHPTPDWVTDLRSHQVDAIKEIVESFNSGSRLVMLDGPTGTGKTLIAQQVAQGLDLDTAYTCSDRGLQDQFLDDFGTVDSQPYARVLKGRSNYPTQRGPSDKTCDDCTAMGDGGKGCWYCATPSVCPYKIAKKQALQSPMAVLNTSYLLTEANYVGDLSGHALVVADECDLLEDALLGFVELRVNEYRASQIGMELPGKGVRKTTIARWLDEFADTMVRYTKNHPLIEAKAQRRNVALADECRVVATELRVDAEMADDTDDKGKWIRDYSKGKPALELKPVRVARHANRYLWRHGARWLCMSATIISPNELADSLGIVVPWELVSVPMTFPVENRPVILAPVANCVYKDGGMDVAIPKLVHATKRILEKHPQDRILIHAVSYKLAAALLAGITSGQDGVWNRPILTYASAADRARTVTEYLSKEASVLIAPSLERGIDLVEDKCRVQILLKTPYPSTADRRVSARMWSENGRLWYAVQTIRSIVQATGRGVRSETDRCTTYILDSQFTSNLYRQNKTLFPKWWRDAIVTDFPIRELLHPS